MPKEIVQIQVGGAGNSIGTKFFENILPEHGLDRSGRYKGKEEKYDLDGADVYFRESGHGSYRYTPRCIITDLDCDSLDMMKRSGIHPIFAPGNHVFGSSSADNNFAKGQSARIAYEIMDVIRREVERCDNPQGFQIVHSLGGGCGSGMGTMILQQLRDRYPDRILLTHSVFPSAKVSNARTEPYNATLAMLQLIKYADATVILDNEALYNISRNELKIDPKYGDFNMLIARGMVGFSAPMRFPSDGLKLQSTLAKMKTNLIPDPRLHFLSLGIAPLTPGYGGIRTMVKDVFSPKNNLCQYNLAAGKSLRAAAIFRGESSRSSVEKELKRLNNTPANLIYEALSVRVKSGADATSVHNNTEIKSVFIRLARQFGAMYRRKAFLHYYKREGMDEMDFQEAANALRGLIDGYTNAESSSKL